MAVKFLYRDPSGVELFPYTDDSGIVNLRVVAESIKALGQSSEIVSSKTRKQLQMKARKLLIDVHARKEMSLTQFTSEVYRAVRAASPAGQEYDASSDVDREKYWYVEEIYPSYVVVEVAGKYYAAAFRLSEDGVEIAPRDQWVEVERRWMQVSSS